MTTRATNSTAALCQHLAASRHTPLPDEVRRRTALHLLDTIAAIVSGMSLRPGVLALEFARLHPGPAEASVAGLPHRSSAISVALANGMLAHADETDDSHAQAFLHPGCAIVPAALAIAERSNASVEHLVRAVAAGYDTAVRVMLAAGPRKRGAARHFDTHAVGGCLGAAAAAAVLSRRSLDNREWQFVLSYAAHQASGMPSYPLDTEHVEKAFIFGGMPARNGVTSSLMVEAGFTGILNDLEGFGGFLSCYGNEDVDAAQLHSDLGVRYEIMNTNLKRYPIGSPCQAPVEALHRLLDNHKLRPEHVASITVGLSTAQERITRIDQSMPNLNLRYLLAATLLDGSLTFAACHDETRLHDPAVLALALRIEVSQRDDLITPESPRQAIVEVTMIDGQRFSHHVVHVPGASEQPMDETAVVAKCRPLIELALGPGETSRLIDHTLDPNAGSAARDIGDLLRRCQVKSSSDLKKR